MYLSTPWFSTSTFLASYRQCSHQCIFHNFLSILSNFLFLLDLSLFFYLSGFFFFLSFNLWSLRKVKSAISHIIFFGIITHSHLVFLHGLCGLFESQISRGVYLYHSLNQILVSTYIIVLHGQMKPFAQFPFPTQLFLYSCWVTLLHILTK